MHTSTETYVHLQKLYKARAEEEKVVFKELLKKESGGGNVDEETVDSFLKNCHALKVLKGKKWGVFDSDREALSGYYFCTILLVIDSWVITSETALQTYPKETSTHLALSALSALPTGVFLTEESLRAMVQNIIGQDVELPDDFDNAVGEM